MSFITHKKFIDVSTFPSSTIQNIDYTLLTDSYSIIQNFDYNYLTLLAMTYLTNIKPWGGVLGTPPC